MSELARIQSFLRESARRQYESTAIPPFTLFFHPTDPHKYFNYAIPDEPAAGDGLIQPLAALRAEFHRRGRLPRLEFFEAFAPDLPAALRLAGFVEEARQWSMLCAAESFRPAPVVPDLHVTFLCAESPLEDVRDFLSTQRRGFGGSAALPTDSEAAAARESFSRGWTGLLGRVDGAPAGVAAFSAVTGCVCEVGGVATLEPYRRRGIASYLTAIAAQTAFEQGADTICLTAEDERAGRVYERIGFAPFSIMLAYSDPA